MQNDHLFGAGEPGAAAQRHGADVAEHGDGDGEHGFGIGEDVARAQEGERPIGAEGQARSSDPGRSEELESLESDIAAVASALETLEQVLAEADAGSDAMHRAAAAIDAVVSPERFGVA